VLLGSGGPDAFGYTWIDSDEPGGPAYDWIDIQGSGIQIPLTGDDENQGPFDIGFDFPFYGEVFSTFNICTNGFVSFTSASAFFYNYGLPDPNAPENLLAVFWDDMDFRMGGEAWYNTDGSQLVISYIGVPHYSSGGPYTYQIVLNSNGIIRYNYQEINYPDDSNTIGIQNGDASIGLQVAYNQTYVHSELTIRISAGWLSTNPGSGTVAPGGNTNVTVICDATTLDAGTYTGSLTVSGRDQYNVLPAVNVPVTFIVRPVSVDEPTVDLPKEFGLSQNYPNPFNPTTEIKFALPVGAHVNIDVFNVLGQKIRSLVDTDMEAGYKSVIWNGTDNAGAPVSSGIYFYKLNAGSKVFSKKMTLLK
jgi:hypothetical protein